MKRNIIEIDQDKCNGCGNCIPNCPEGAIQIIDNKARLVGDLMCDGLGACLGHCPEGAISVVERDAEVYDERKVMINIVNHGANTIKAHLKHLKNHGEDQLLNVAIDYLKENNIDIPNINKSDMDAEHFTGCPGSATVTFKQQKSVIETDNKKGESRLTHWPIQMHLISPAASHYRGSDMILAADCVAYCAGNFHNNFLEGKTLAIACPKLDNGQEIYLEKIKSLVDIAKINTLTIVTMQVPCCNGLLRLVQKAVTETSRKIPVKSIIISIEGDLLSEEWI